MTNAQKFRKKPVEIDAMQWDGTAKDAERVVAWLFSCGEESHYQPPNPHLVDGLFIVTLEGEMRATAGDWIIRGVKGEFYPCKPDIFAATYDPVDPPTTTGLLTAANEQIDERYGL